MRFSLVGHIIIEHGGYKRDVTEGLIVQTLRDRQEGFKTARMGLTEMWKECWALYVGTPEAMEYSRMRILHTVGDPNQAQWHSRVNTGKCYEIIENMVGYIYSAMFPNDTWFEPIPTAPGYMDLVKPLRTLLNIKLTEAQFQFYSKVFIRQLLITGVSTMGMPWRYETMPSKKRVQYSVPEDGYQSNKWTTVIEDRVIKNSPDFLIQDSFDIYFDPTCPDPNRADMFRRIVKTRAEVKACIENGYYKAKWDEIDDNRPNYLNDADVTRSFISVNPNVLTDDNTIEVWEYWGDIHLPGVTIKNVLATYIGHKLVRFEPNPYWDGRPFVSAQFIPLIGTPYGLSAVIPNMGLLHEMNVVTNSRLDNLNLQVDKMWECVEDGLLDDDVIRTEPGKVFKVREKGTINPIEPGNPGFVVTYQESNFLQNTVNANFGTGPALGNQPMRSGERVTAQEIIAMQDAGGNRLSSIFVDIESQFLLTTLQRMYAHMQQFLTEDQLVPTLSDDPGKLIWIWFGPTELAQSFKFKALGSRYVIGKKRFFDDLQVLFNFLSVVPEARPNINFEKLLHAVIHRLSFDEPDSFINPQAGAGLPEMSPQDDPAEIMRRMGGEPTMQALNNQMQIDPEAALSQLVQGTVPKLGDVEPGMNVPNVPLPSE